MPATQLNWLGARLVQGRYHVTAHLGEGGMGQVYKARDRKLGSDVVIKVPRPALLEDPEFAARFTREVRALVRLEHPHIVKVIDVDEHDGVPFAVMAYLAGGSLEDRLPSDREGRRVAGEPGQLGEWLADVSSALDFVHKKGFIHRDVKPANILFDSQGHVFLSDFGIAKALAEGSKDTNLTGTGVVLGTPAYLAPEMALGKQFDSRADQYSLAVSIYELLAGRVPFEGPTPAAVLLKQTSETPPRLDAQNRTVTKSLADALHKALAKDPAQRYPTCSAFAKAVCAALPPEELDSIPLLRKERLRVACPACGKSCRLPAEAEGRRVRCPGCQHAFQAPSARGDKAAAKADTRPNAQAELDTQQHAFAAERPGRRSFPLLALILGAIAAVVVLGIVAVSLAFFLGSKPGAAVAKNTETPKQDSPQVKAPVLTLGHSELALEPGKSQKVQVTVERNGHEGPIELNIDGLPRRVRPSVPRIAADKNTTELEFFADADAPAAEGTASITGKIGDTKFSDQCKITVLASARPPESPLKEPSAPAKPTAPLTGSFRLLPIADVEIEIGGRGTITVAVERSGYDGPIDLRLSGDQVRWFGTPRSQVPEGQDRATMTIQVDPSAPPTSRNLEPLTILLASVPGSAIKPDQKEFVIRLKSKPEGQPTTPVREPDPEVTNVLGMKLIWVTPGSFLMGSPEAEPQRDASDEQQHRVTLTRGFYLGMYEVTQEEYVRLIGVNPSKVPDPLLPKNLKPSNGFSPAGGGVRMPEDKTPRMPVDSVTWEMADSFCKLLSQNPSEKQAGRSYRLPTEAEWEYACRAGTSTAYSFGNDARELGNYAWYPSNAQRKPHPVGQKKPNRWGFFDMHGNLGEWCADWYDAAYYQSSPAKDPKGPPPRKHRVYRGGMWDYDPKESKNPAAWLRSAQRLEALPAIQAQAIGFRVACDLVAPNGKAGAGGQPLPKPPE